MTSEEVRDRAEAWLNRTLVSEREGYRYELIFDLWRALDRELKKAKKKGEA